MRSFFTGIFLLVSSSFAHAAIDPDALRDLAYQGDFQGVDAAMAEAHQQSLTGEISYDELRDLVSVLIRTHPDMDDFRLLWIENLPASPYAQMATAWSLYGSSFAIRGTALPRESPRAAIENFSRMQHQAMQLALSAYDTAPDFVPASDGILRMQKTTNRLWGWMINSIIADTMTVTPNFGSLTRASELSDPRWGGPGQDYILELCETYFDKIPEYPDLTKDVCIVGLLQVNDQLDGNWDYVADVLDREDHDVLTDARVSRALERRTGDDRQLVMDYLRSVRFDNPWIRNDVRIAHRFVGMVGHGLHPEADAFVQELEDRLISELRTEMEHNPFYLPLLQVAIRDQYLATPFFPRETREVQNYQMRIAVLQPYHIDNWHDARRSTSDLINPAYMNTLDAPSYYAIAYSDHDLSEIMNFLRIKLEQYTYYNRRPNSAGLNGIPRPPQEEIEREIGCRVAQLIRLFDDAAEQASDRRNAIDGFRINENLAEIGAAIKASGHCNHIWDAELADLRFAPTEFDRRSLLIIPEEPTPPVPLKRD